jgi:DNA-binding response OmpR family regulator
MRSIRILLVDDDRALVDTVEGALRNEGFDVIAAHTFMDACDVVDSPAEIDVLVTDVVLDRGNGIALARFARTRRPRLKTVYITDVASSLDLSGIESPLLPKPFGILDLKGAIESLLPVDRV